MKKLISLVLVVAVIAVAGYFVYDLYLSPEATAERNLMGKWVGSYEIGGFTFEEDGVVRINVGKISTDGTYTVDFETGDISITYSALGLSYEKDYSFDVTESTLKLTDKTLGVTLDYTKSVPQEN